MFPQRECPEIRVGPQGMVAVVFHDWIDAAGWNPLSDIDSPPCLTSRLCECCCWLSLATRHGARNVRVFGSMARGEARPDSDVDFLIDVEPGRTLLDVIALEQDLEALLGRPVE